MPSNPFTYTGREDDGTGLMYYRARYYDPELEVFISQDPLGDAQRYVGGNPMSFVDPLGLYLRGKGLTAKMVTQIEQSLELMKEIDYLAESRNRLDSPKQIGLLLCGSDKIRINPLSEFPISIKTDSLGQTYKNIDGTIDIYIDFAQDSNSFGTTLYHEGLHAADFKRSGFAAYLFSGGDSVRHKEIYTNSSDYLLYLTRPDLRSVLLKRK